jgi:hypothetical protein
MSEDTPLTLAAGKAIMAAATAATGALGLYQDLSIICALAEARLIDPRSVAKWATFFSANLPPNTPAEIRESIREGLSGFAAALRSVATIPGDSGRA